MADDLTGLRKDSEDWREVIRRAPDEELLALHEADYLGLIRMESGHWRDVFDAAEEELRSRGVNESRKAA
jgi:hypothetical protein